MATFVHGKSIKVLVDGGDLSSYFNDLSTSAQVDTAETSAFGDSAKSYVTGLTDGTLQLSGMFDGTASAVDAVLSAKIGAAVAPVITVAPNGSFAIGNRVLCGQAIENNYEVSASIGDVVKVSAQFQGSGGFRGGVSLHPLAAETATGNGTSVDQTAATSFGGYATLHITAASGTTPTLVAKVQHSVDNSTFTDLITFTSASAVGSQYQAVTSTVNRYIRETHTLGGTTPSFTFVVAFVRFVG